MSRMRGSPAAASARRSSSARAACDSCRRRRRESDAARRQRRRRSRPSDACAADEVPGHALLFLVACFALWAFAARAAMPADRSQVKHLAVTGILMHAGYLGGVWAAVKLGMGAGLVALLVGLQPVLTAAWVSSRGGAVLLAAMDGSGARLRRTGTGRVAEAGDRRNPRPELPAGAGRLAQHHRRHPVSKALRRTLRRAHRQPCPAVCCPGRDLAAGAAGNRNHATGTANSRARWPGRCWP